jgi:hypothetical protein
MEASKMDSPIVRLAILGAALYGAWRFGGPYGKAAALGVAGYVIANQVPVVRDGLNARIAA